MNSTNPIDSTNPACDQSRRLLLDLALRADARANLIKALAHVETCDACRSAVEDYEKICNLLAPAPEPDESHLAPGKWDQWVDQAMRQLPSPQRPSLRLVPTMRFTLAASIALILAFGGYWLGRRPESTSVASVPSPIVAPIAAADLSSRTRAFEQVNKAFDNRAGWMLVSDLASDVGLDAQPSSDKGMLLIRLTLSRLNTAGNVSEPKTQIVSSADLAILPGRTAKLSLPFPQGRLLSYEISVGTGDPTRLGLIAELLPVDQNRHTPNLAKPLAALSTTLDLQPGGASPAGSFVTGNADYELTVGFSKAELALEKSP